MKKNFSSHVMTVFSDFNTDHESMTNLMTDLALGREIYDGDKLVSKAEANDIVRRFALGILEIGDNKDVKSFRRAWRDHGREWFDVIEDTVDNVIETGLQASEWFEDLVERKTLNYYDRQDFYIDTDSILAVAKAGVSHHTHPLQRLGKGTTVSLTPDLYVVKVGADINRYITGQEDWARLVTAIARAFMVKIQTEVFNAVDTAATLLPVQGTDFINTGTLSAATKGAFDKIVSNVAYANPGAEIVIMGTNNALKNLNALGDVNWISNLAKDSVYNIGRMGLYEGTRLVEIDNRFTDKTYTAKVFKDNRLLILPVIGDAGRFVKVIDEGTVEIEHTERDEKYASDLMSMEVQRRFGVGVVIGHQFGQWTI
jgi:hypothetical protein